MSTDHDLSDFARYVLSGDPIAETFTPSARYDPDGDCYEFLVSGESYYGRYVDPRLTLYVGRETGEIVGCLIYCQRPIVPGPAGR